MEPVDIDMDNTLDADFQNATPPGMILNAIDDYWGTQDPRYHPGTTIRKTPSAVRMLDIEDFDYDEATNRLTLVDDLPMYLPWEPYGSFREFEQDVDHRLDRMIYVRNDVTKNVVTFTYQALQYLTNGNNAVETIECHYVVQPGSTWSSKLRNQRNGHALRLILTYEIKQ
jgi:hypothetical protein